MPTPTFQPYSPGINENADGKIKGLTNAYIETTRYLEWILSHLDEKNVLRAKRAEIAEILAGTISADQITSGTINASVIDVINLDADNIVTGTMSANRIYGGTISGVVINVSTDVYVGEKVNITIGDLSGGVYWDSAGNDNLTCDPGGALDYTSHFYAEGLHAYNAVSYDTFQTADGKTVTVEDGIITDIT